MRGRGAAHARRLQRVALAVLLAGVLAIPLQLSPHSFALRLSTPLPTGDDVVAVPATSVEPSPTPEEDPGDRPITPPSAGDLGQSSDVVFEDTDRDDGLAVTGSVATGAESGPASVFAVVVGIDDYPGLNVDLQSAVADADAMAAVLANLGVPSTNIVRLSDQQATAAAIVDSAEWLAGVAGPDSTAIFSYAGHARKLDVTREAVVGADGALVTDTLLAQKLAPLAARGSWIVMATCYAAGFDELLAPGRVLTAASDAQSLAYENVLLGHSYLGEYLIKRALLEERGGEPTAQQAFASAQTALLRDLPQRALTQIDRSTEPVSLDGVRRVGEPSAVPVGPPPPVTAPPTPPRPAATTVPPPPPPTTAPCRKLGLFCSPG